MPCECTAASIPPHCESCCEHLWDGWPQLQVPGPTEERYPGQEPPEWVSPMPPGMGDIEAAGFVGALLVVYSCNGPCRQRVDPEKNNHKYLVRCARCPLTKLSVVVPSDRSQPFSNPVLVGGKDGFTKEIARQCGSHIKGKWHPFWHAVCQLVAQSQLTTEDEDQYCKAIKEKNSAHNQRKDATGKERGYNEVKSKFLVKPVAKLLFLATEASDVLHEAVDFNKARFALADEVIQR